MRLLLLLLTLLFGHVPTRAQEHEITCIDSPYPVRDISDCIDLLPLVSVGRRDESLFSKYKRVFNFPAAFRRFSCVITIAPIIDGRHHLNDFPMPASNSRAYGIIFHTARKKVFSILNECSLIDNTHRNIGVSVIEVLHSPSLVVSPKESFGFKIQVFGLYPNALFANGMVGLWGQWYHDYNLDFLYSKYSLP
jgi:hypothetical protein